MEPSWTYCTMASASKRPPRSEKDHVLRSSTFIRSISLSFFLFLREEPPKERCDLLPEHLDSKSCSQQAAKQHLKYEATCAGVNVAVRLSRQDQNNQCCKYHSSPVETCTFHSIRSSQKKNISRLEIACKRPPVSPPSSNGSTPERLRPSPKPPRPQKAQWPGSPVTRQIRPTHRGACPHRSH